MRTRLRRATLLGLLASLGGCFPDDRLNPVADAADDLALDLPVEASAPDAAPDVAPDVDDAALDALDASMDADDVADVDDLGDVAAEQPEDAGRCARLPTAPVSPSAVADRLADATDVAFDGAGRALLASLRDVVSLGAMGSRTLLFSALPGNATALRFNAAGEALLAMVPATAGASLGSGPAGSGAVFAGPASGTSTPAWRFAVARPGGLAVDRGGALWVSDTANNRVLRVSPRADDAGLSMTPVLTDVNGPTHLAFDATGATLYVAATSMGGTLYRVALTDSPSGVTAAPAVGVARDLGAVTGLAVDACGSVYVADETGGRVLRALAMSSDLRPIVTDVPRVRGLAFGQGAGFDAQTLYFVSNGSLLAAPVGAPGVALPVPPM